MQHLFLFVPLLALLTGGCALGVAATGASVAASGKTVTDHALDAATGKDCRLVQGASRSDRDVCEKPGSAATRKDFKGLGKGE